VICCGCRWTVGRSTVAIVRDSVAAAEEGRLHPRRRHSHPPTLRSSHRGWPLSHDVYAERGAGWCRMLRPETWFCGPATTFADCLSTARSPGSAAHTATRSPTPACTTPCSSPGGVRRPITQTREPAARGAGAEPADQPGRTCPSAGYLRDPSASSRPRRSSHRTSRSFQQRRPDSWE